MLFGVTLLTWDELERGRGPLELEPLRAELERAAAAALALREPSPWTLGLRVETELNRVLVERFGVWVGGWCWGVCDGGLVRSWAGARSVAADGPPSVTIERVFEAVREWHALIDALAALFETLRPAEDAELAEVVERAAAALVTWAVARTETNDAWYHAFAAVLAWYLQAWALDDATAEAEINRIISGRFESWVAPAEQVRRSTCADLGLATALRYERTPPDATLVWIGVRRSAFAQVRGFGPPTSRHPPGDGHRRFIEGLERRRDRVRADHMRAALSSCRKAARSNKPLDFTTLARWNAIVLGQPSAERRTTDAYAKAGRERYGAFADETLVAYLAEAGDPEVPVWVRAARVYLDVCFFHPFVDGNARTARLALDWVLAREGFGLHVAEPVFMLARAANDPLGASELARLIWMISTRLS